MNQHVQPLALATPSAVESPDGLTYQWERFRAVVREISPMLREHYASMGAFADAIPLDFDYDTMLQLDLVGRLGVLTVRDGTLLVGYITTVLSSPPFTANALYSSVQMYWLRPEYRQGFTGVRMFRMWAEESVKAGAKVLQVTTTVHYRNSRNRSVDVILRRLGFRHTEQVFARLGG